jgi:CheY-like chemotaxis protein
MQQILVVDDERYNLNMVRRLLENEQMTVQYATSGEEALWKLNKSTFDLMITDLNMPGMNGFVLSRKAAAIAPDMPIVMFTGDICPEVMTKASEAGIVTVLGKPFSSEKLLKLVREVTKGTHTQVARPAGFGGGTLLDDMPR